MTRDDACDRLLADPADSSAELRAFLAGDAEARAFANRVRGIDDLVRRQPVPDSTPAKATFLASLRNRSVAPSSLVPAERASRGRASLVAAVLAASVLIAVGVTAMRPKPGAVVRMPKTASPAHALLEESTRFLVEAGRQRPDAAVRQAGHLMAELRGIYLAAGPDDAETVRTFAGLMRRVLDEGINESTLPKRPDERRTAMDAVMARLAGLGEATRAMATNAPVHHQPTVALLQEAVDAAIARLTTLGAASASPIEVPSAAGRDAGLQLALARRDRAMIEIVIDRGLKAAAAADAVARAEELRAGAQAVEMGLATAIREGDDDRIGELGDRLVAIYADGLTPAFRSAVTGHDNPESPGFARVRELRTRARDDVLRVRALLPATAPQAELRRRIESATAGLL